MAESTVVKLTPNMDVQEAMTLVVSGAVPMEAYLEWDADRIKAASTKATRTALRITISPAGNVSFNGVRRKKEGPLYSPIEDIPVIVGLLPEVIAKGIAAASIIVPADATQRVQRDNWKRDRKAGFVPKDKSGKAQPDQVFKVDGLPVDCTDENRFVDAKHPRAGKSRLRFRDGTDQAAVVAQLRELAEFFAVTDSAIAEAHAELTK